MTQHPSPLGDAIANLRKAPAGTHRGMLPEALHTLITAILARIFARLEAILRLWQAGELPTPTPRHRAAAPARQASNRQTSAPQRARRRATIAKPVGRISAAPSDSLPPLRTWKLFFSIMSNFFLEISPLIL